MSTYHTRTKTHRKIYEKHYGPIPCEPNGRSYDIHHIDGDHSNNDPTNLIAVTTQEHYDIHYKQGDYGACYFITIQRLNSSPEEISAIAKKVAEQRVIDGTHPWSDKNKATARNRKRTAEGKNPFTGGDIQRKQIADGRHGNKIRVSCLCCKRNTTLIGFNRYHKADCNFSA